MKLFQHICFFALLAGCVGGCKKDYTETAFVSSSASASKTAVMFNITQDNTGLVTITPSGDATTSYDITLGDTTKTPVTITAGNSVKHIYGEGQYNVKVVGHDLKGGTSTTTQQLTVSYITPANLVAKVGISNLTVTVSASAQYATFYKIYYGDSTTSSPEPFTQVLAKQDAVHTYTHAGTYIIRVIALSGGSETAQFLDTVTVSRQIDLPVTFEDPNTDYTVSDFGGNVSVPAADPTNGANHVLKTTKPAGAETWAGTTIGGGLGFATPVALKANAAKLSIMVYSPAAGLDIKLKVEDHNDGTHSVETDVLTTKTNQWETLTFDFTQVSVGTPALNASWNYDKASVFFDFNNAGTGKVFYCDNLQVASAPLTQIDLPVTFESTTVDYTVSDFGGNASSLATDPTDAGNHVMKSIKTNGAMTWAGTTIGGAGGFATSIPQTPVAAKMTVKVYAPAANLDIKLKLEEHANGANSVETDVMTTTAGWQTLTFDFSQAASATPAWNASFKYDKASLFFDFGNAGTGSVFYFDDVIKL